MDLEQEFLDWVRREFALRDDFGAVDLNVVKSIGDDCAVIDRGDKYELIGNDLLTEGNHFSGKWCSPEQIGRKAVESNVSDIAAMGGVPKYLFVALVLPRDIELEYLKAIYRGMKQVCEKYEITLLGGDTTSGCELTISITLTGEVEKDKLVTRSGAMPGDLIFTTGSLGASMAGLEILRAVELQGAGLQEFLEELSVEQQEAFYYCIDMHLKPMARLKEGMRLAALGASAMIDVSDGLASEVRYIGCESGCAAKVFETKIPIDDRVRVVAEVLGKDPLNFALSGGEDFELVFTAPKNFISTLAAAHPDFDIFEVGEILELPRIGGKPIQESAYILIKSDDSQLELPGGYRHF